MFTTAANTNTINTTTWHDRCPSHNVKPAWLIGAQEARDLAYANYGLVVDEAMTAGAWDRDELDKAEAAYDIAQVALDDLSALYHNGCTCTPNGLMACRLCRLDFAEQYPDGEMPY
jgi:hypothetical protein